MSDKAQSVKSAAVRGRSPLYPSNTDHGRKHPGPPCPRCGEQHGKLIQTRRASLVLDAPRRGGGAMTCYRLRLYSFQPCQAGTVLTGELVLHECWPKRWITNSRGQPAVV